MNICILYYINKTSIKYYKWYDGFTKAIEILSKKYNVDMINIYDNKDIKFDKYDYVFLKESFNGAIYNKYKQKLSKYNKLGLFISSSNNIPTDNQLKIYDILYYETEWYYKYARLNRHKQVYHAFGIDTEIMKEKKIKKEYDIIFVGNICKYKRPEKILNIPGKKICLGFKTDKYLVEKLEKNNVIVKDFVEYKELSIYYNKSKLCYIPCEIHGGGERAILEARSCNIPIRIEKDNDKLKELCESKIYTSKYYYNQIDLGIRINILIDIVNNKNYEIILNILRKYHLNVLEIGGMDGKTFDPLYNNISEKWKLIILEPIKYQFEKLKKNYENKSNVILINKALDYSSENKNMYTINSEVLKDNKLPLWFNGISSFYNNRNALAENYWETRGKVHKGLTYKSIKNYIITENVSCITIEDLKKKYNIKNIDILQIDTEGFDYHILKIVLKIFKPLVILFEWNNLPNNELYEIKNQDKLLYNYNVIYYNQDALCIYKIK